MLSHETQNFEDDQKQLVEVSDMVDTEERKTVKIKSQIHFDHVRSIVHSKFFPHGQMINQQVYKEILHSVLRSECEKRRELWQDKSLLLHNDNAPVHNTVKEAAISSRDEHRSLRIISVCIRTRSGWYFFVI